MGVRLEGSSYTSLVPPVNNLTCNKNGMVKKYIENKK